MVSSGTTTVKGINRRGRGSVPSSPDLVGKYNFEVLGLMIVAYSQNLQVLLGDRGHHDFEIPEFTMEHC